VFPLHGPSLTQKTLSLHEVSQVTLSYRMPDTGPCPIAPQQSRPFGQSAGTLHSIGAPQSLATHAVLGVLET
jgi:hypothetical protein